MQILDKISKENISDSSGVSKKHLEDRVEEVKKN